MRRAGNGSSMPRKGMDSMGKAECDEVAMALRVYEYRCWNALADVVKILRARVERFQKAVREKDYEELANAGTDVDEAYRAVIFYSVAVNSLRGIQLNWPSVGEENQARDELFKK